MSKFNTVFRVVRNVFIALISASWIVPLWAAIDAMLYIMKFQEAQVMKDEWPGGPSFSYIELSEWILPIAMCLLVVVIIFWAFVAANKLWPIRNSKEPDNQKDDPKKEENTL